MNETCTCAMTGPERCRRHRDLYDPLAAYDGAAGGLVPGWHDSADGKKDAADQARMDQR